MAQKSMPDHAGRMPDHPRYGNPSDPAEEVQRIRRAYQNIENWQDQYGEFSGGVSMQYGSGKVYEVPIGDPEIAAKIVSRPIASQPVKALPEPAESAPEPVAIWHNRVLTPDEERHLHDDPYCFLIYPPPQPWIWRFINLIKGIFK